MIATTELQIDTVITGLDILWEIMYGLILKGFAMNLVKQILRSK